MKKLLTVILALLTFGSIYAQNSLLNLKETSILINGVSVNVVHTMLKGDIKDINKSWSSFIKTHLNERMREDNGVLMLKETVVNQITDKRGDLLVYIYNIDNEASFNILTNVNFYYL
ncbi:MAG: hypothetical protein RBS19_11780 [Bacteroidales bacterium]|nr:hypothetical protein [Bacteroidales bacterium]